MSYIIRDGNNLFESIKKKFAEASGKLTNKVSKEAEEENNLKIEGKIQEEQNELNSTVKKDINKETSMDKSEITSIGLKNSEEIENSSNDSNIEKDNDIKENKESTFSKIGEKLKFRKSQDEDFINEIHDDEVDDKSLNKDKISQNGDISSINEKISEEKELEDKKLEDKKLDDKESKDTEKKSGIFSFIREKTISEKDLDDILWELELSLLESDVAIDVANFVVESVKKDLIGQKIKRSNDVEEYTYQALRNAVSKIIDIEGKSMTDMLEEKNKKGEPLVVMFVGINGTGKTTSIAKLANYYIKKGYTPVVAASDTFRAGAIEQISYHTDKLGVKIVKHEKGSDPAAVAYDAVEHAKAKGKELVLIDTAGRMQTNTNLMDEMKKIRRVSKPDLVVFVGDALTGNDAVEQATKFNDAIDIDGVILTKADADSKGGASLSIGYVIGKPIMFLGMGQTYDDIKEYDPDWMLDQIFS